VHILGGITSFLNYLWCVLHFAPIEIELLPLLVAFVGTLLIGLEYGVPLACGVHVVFLLYRHARPRHKVCLCGNTCLASPIPDLPTFVPWLLLKAVSKSSDSS
jgi:hypothetical protein